MIDDEAEYNARRQIRAQADADVAAFIASLDQDEESGVPPPVKIKISEVSTQPVEFAPFDFGGEGAGTTPAPSPPPPPATCGCPLDSDSLSVVLDGIVNNGCVSFPSFGSFRVNGDPNTSYTLVNDSPGHWQLASPITGVFTLDRYGSDTDCVDFFRTDDMNLFVAVTCHADSGIEVSAWLEDVATGGGPFCSVFLKSDPNPCTRVLNNPAVLDGFFGSGTATISIL